MNYKDGLSPIIEKHKQKLIDNGWWPWFESFTTTKAFEQLNQRLINDSHKGYNIYPTPDDVFRLFLLLPLNNIKVIIQSQDPYHNPNAAHGIAFSHPTHYEYMQPSLKNIYKELENDGYKVNYQNCNLESWVTQGVFLINSALTVLEGQAGSHSAVWKPITTALFQYIAQQHQQLVVIMWGKHAQSFEPQLNQFYLLQSGHPSPYSSHLFFNHHHFSLTNQKLIEWHQTPIDWHIQ